MRLPSFAPVRNLDISGLNERSQSISVDFPQFFPQVWKTLGTDQTRMGVAGVRQTQPVKEPDSNTVQSD